MQNIFSNTIFELRYFGKIFVAVTEIFFHLYPGKPKSYYDGQVQLLKGKTNFFPS
jgi:hypothetical protein